MMEKVTDRFSNMREQLETLAAASEENAASTRHDNCPERSNKQYCGTG